MEPGESLGTEVVLDLGFGQCKLQVQVPRDSPSNDPKDLIGKRIATSFTGLSRKYFANLEGHNSLMTPGDGESGNRLRTSVLPLGGSVETACALGAADGIVDLVGE